MWWLRANKLLQTNAKAPALTARAANAQVVPNATDGGTFVVADAVGAVPPDGVNRGLVNLQVAGPEEVVDDAFVCPITHECMIDPVFLADGHEYERSAITEWLNHHDTSPLTGKVLTHKTVTSALTLRNAITELKHKQNRNTSKKRPVVGGSTLTSLTYESPRGVCHTTRVLSGTLPEWCHWHGRAKDGSRVFHLLGARYDPKVGSREAYVLDLAAKMDAGLDRRSDEKVTVLFDTRGRIGWASPKLKALLPIMTAVCQLFSDHFPGRVARLVVYTVGQREVRTVQHALANTTAKVSVLGGGKSPPKGTIDAKMTSPTQLSEFVIWTDAFREDQQARHLDMRKREVDEYIELRRSERSSTASAISGRQSGRSEV